MRSEIKNAVLNDDRIYLSVRVPRSRQGSLISEINTIPGRQYHGETGKWSIPLNRYGLDKITELGFSKNSELENWTGKNNSRPLKIDLPVGLALRPFQVEGVKRLEELNGRALLADEMRLGKTIQALSYMILHPELRPAIIVPPASYKIGWSRECSKWLTHEKHVIVQGHSHALSEKDNILIINYDILSTYIDLILEFEPKLLILDECHLIKSKKAMRTRAVKYIGKNIEHVIGISGTPILSRPSEFWNILNLIDGQMFNSHQRFLNEYCDAARDPSGKGSSNTKRLNEVLKKSFMIRRLRKEVYSDLPDKERSIIPMELNNRKEYDEAEKDIIQYIRDNDGDAAARRAAWAETVVRFEKLKQLAVKGKFDQIVEWIESFIESEKLVVFCIHRNVVDALAEKFSGRCVTLYGGDSPAKKQNAIDSFQNKKEITLFIGNIKAAGSAIQLSAAENTAFIEMDWVPGNHDQAEDRVIDVNKKVPTMAYYLVGLNTIEEDIATLLDNKRKTLDAVMDGADTENKSLLTYLINEYKSKRIK
jgi:SWI/SNF-related matrix-associated actin-dependent regulator 1 of chromatin subfamily A